MFVVCQYIWWHFKYTQFTLLHWLLWPCDILCLTDL